MGIKFTVYRTTNLVNGRFYLGVHKTSVLDDGYLGSGKLLKRAIAKHGEANFRKDVLFVFETDEEAFRKEFELVEAAKADPLCYNLRQGGSGGFDWINKKPDQAWRVRAGVRANQTIQKRCMQSVEYREATRARRIKHIRYVRSEADKERAKHLSLMSAAAWRGQHHSPETLKLMSELKRGSANKQFGKKWMYSPVLGISKPFPKKEVEGKMQTGWLLGRK